MADAQDLKSCDPYRSYRFDPGLRHQANKKDNNLILYRYRGVEQLVARRAHNPEAVGSNPAPATMKSHPRQNASGLLISTYPSDCNGSGDLPPVQVSAGLC